MRLNARIPDIKSTKIYSIDLPELVHSDTEEVDLTNFNLYRYYSASHLTNLRNENASGRNSVVKVGNKYFLKSHIDKPEENLGPKTLPISILNSLLLAGRYGTTPNIYFSVIDRLSTPMDFERESANIRNQLPLAIHYADNIFYSRNNHLYVEVSSPTLTLRRVDGVRVLSADLLNFRTELMANCISKHDFLLGQSGIHPITHLSDKTRIH